MNCKRVRAKLALYISDDLSRRWQAKIDAHLKGCPDCQLELKNLKEALVGIKEADRAESRSLPDWGRTRWDELMKEISRTETGRKGRPAPPVEPRKRLAYRLAAAAGLFILVLAGYFMIGEFRLRPSRPQAAEKEAIGIPEGSRQSGSLPERIEMVFRLPESGVQVVWILDRNFNPEGVKK